MKIKEERAFDKILKNLKEKKECTSVLDYILKIDARLKGCDPEEYEGIKRMIVSHYIMNKKTWDNLYEESINKAKEENIILTSEDIQTLRSLEEAGYIKIIEYKENLTMKEIKVLKEKEEI